MSISMTTFMLPKDNVYVVLAKQAIATFMGKAKAYEGAEDQRAATLGTPAIYVFNAWFSHMWEQCRANAESDQVAHAALTACKNFSDPLNQLQDAERTMETTTQVLHVMISEPFDKRHRKVDVALAKDAHQIFANLIYMDIKKQKGFRQLVGQAPRTALERKLQEYLDQGREE